MDVQAKATAAASDGSSPIDDPAVERWFGSITELVAQNDEEFFKIIGLIEEIEERFTPTQEDLAA